MDGYRGRKVTPEERERDHRVVVEITAAGDGIVLRYHHPSQERRPVEKGTWLFVWDTEGRLYVGPDQKWKFHHSCLTASMPVRMAGELTVSGDDGRLVEVQPNSGHYKPTNNHTRAFFRYLKREARDQKKLLDVVTFKNEFTAMTPEEYRAFLES